ncbi:hypothetical protein [Peterkaempfera bronchialis]|uniref:hypothetical protein n=1 Tax=Peterkaempfera bronchialis TaxID=2126346 RepID=UPI003C2F8D07
MSGGERPGLPSAEGPEPGMPQAPGEAQEPGGPERKAPTGEPVPAAHLRLVRDASAAVGRPQTDPDLGPDLGHDLDGGSDGLDAVEREIRAMLRNAVDELQPTPDALQRIQRAVPQRRARRLQAWVGSAAVLLLAVAAVPALRTAAGSQNQGRVSAAGPVQDPDRGGSGPSPSWGDGATPPAALPLPGTTTLAPGVGVRDPSGGSSAISTEPAMGQSVPAAPDGWPINSEQSSPKGSADAPVCRSAQLGAGTTRVESADSSGKVYGSFLVVNSSVESCVIDGAGTVWVSAATGTDASRVPILVHTGGDPATGLPDPSTGSDRLLLQPGAGYQVRFGWVPDGSNGTACTTTPSTTPSSSPSEGDGPAGETGGEGTAAVAATATDSQGAARSSVSLSHTPAAGAPMVGPATIPGACSGTVYRTGPLPAG